MAGLSGSSLKIRGSSRFEAPPIAAGFPVCKARSSAERPVPAESLTAVRPERAVRSPAATVRCGCEMRSASVAIRVGGGIGIAAHVHRQCPTPCIQPQAFPGNTATPADKPASTPSARKRRDCPRQWAGTADSGDSSVCGDSTARPTVARPCLAPCLRGQSPLSHQ